MTEYLTTKELGDLLRLKERKIYDLAASGKVPCTKVTGKLLFPLDQIEAWLASGQQSAAAAPVNRRPVFLGSHDPLLEWSLRQSNCGLATYLSGSGDGLSRFVLGEGIATGMHIFDEAARSWNVSAVERNATHLPAVLIRLWTRSRGILKRPGDDVTGLDDLRERRFAARPEHTGAQILFESLAKDKGIKIDTIFASESDAAQAVVQLEADAAFGLPSIARENGLDFVPVVQEPFDILVDRHAYFETPMQRFMNFARSQRCRAYAIRLGGYDMADCGRILFNGK